MTTDGTCEFRVSDSLFVPLRGQLLRLKVAAGTPAASAVAAGRTLTVHAPDGRSRDVTILDHSITGGRLTQARLDRVRELDVVIPLDQASIEGETIGIGWIVRAARS
jgi:hypothetical protein